MNQHGVAEVVSLLQEIIIAVRNARAEMKVDPRHQIAAEFSSPSEIVRDLVRNNESAIMRLATLSSFDISDKKLGQVGGVLRSNAQFDLRIAYDGTVDKPAEIARLRKEIDRLAKDIESKKGRLGDETFLSKAPAKIVEDLKTTLAGREIEHQKLLDRLNQLA